MVDPRRVLSLGARLVPAVVFVDVIRATVATLPVLLQPASAGLQHAALSPSAVAIVVSGIAAALAVATGSAAAYSAALVALVLARIPLGSPEADPESSGLEVPWTGVAGLFVLLALDSYATAYRKGGTGLPSPRVRSALKSLGALLILSAPFAAASAVVGVYLSALLGLLGELPSRLGGSPLRFLAESRLTYTVLALAAFLALVRLLDSAAGVLVPFLLPSRRLSLRVLVDEADVGRVFAPPLLWTVLGLASLAFYPAVHTLVFEVILGVPEEPGLWVSALTHAVSLLATSYAVFGSFGRPLLRSRGAGIGPAVLVLLLVYAGAVAVRLRSGVDLLGSVLAPDFAGLLETLGRRYTDYSRGLLSLAESLFRLLGVAP